MGRERDRIARRMEKNPALECNKIQKKFYPELFTKFGQIADPRHSSYIDHNSRVMLGTVYYKGIAGITSICIVADGLYVSEKVIRTCEGNNWEYIIRYKEGCTPTIEEEYRSIPEKERAGNAEYINGVIFKDREINVLKYRETKVKKGEAVTTEFAWITSFGITKGNAEKLARAGRSRWKIENQGFNRQKRWQGDIEHACSFNERAQKNHYLLEQISDFMKQLYEYYYLKRNGIKKTQKKYLLSC